MLIAIPVSGEKLDLHFGHCRKFSLVKVDFKNKNILSQENVDAPPHEPGLLPKWLGEQGVDMVIAGGMGQRAKELLVESGIKVLVGAPQEVPEVLVKRYLDGILKFGENCCDH